MKCALLIIDMQVGYLEEYSDQNPVKNCIDYINYVSALFRAANQPVIHIQDFSEADDMTAEQLAISPLVTQTATDIVVQKTFSNGFHKTKLADTLNALGVDLLVLSGQAAEHCVVFTYNGAAENGYPAVILQGGVTSQNANLVKALMEDRNLVSHTVLKTLFNSTP